MTQHKFSVVAWLGLAWVTLVAGPALAQTAIPAGVGYKADVVYCACDDGTRLTLDIAWPQGGNGPAPAVVCIHGGGWVMERDHAAYRDLIVRLAKEGYVGVSVTYRLAPKHRCPAAIHDVKCAVRWLRANAASYGIDKERIAALGYSSGGHLACMLALATGPEWEGHGGCANQSSRVQAVVSVYGITDLKRVHENSSPLTKFAVEQFLGGPPDKVGESYIKASPVYHVSDQCPPFLFIHGTQDKFVPLEQSQLLRNRLEEVGHRPALLNLKGADHRIDAKPSEHKELAYAALFDFLSRHLKSGAVAGQE